MAREMKDSRIEWIGMIPASWDIVPNKLLMKKRKIINVKYSDEPILSLTIEGVITRNLDAGGKMPTSFDGYQKVDAGNLLMCLFDIDVTPRCIGLIKRSGVTSPAYSQFVMRPGNFSPYYNYYYLFLDNDKLLLPLAKNLRHSFTEDELGKIPTVRPPYKEQRMISYFLDSQCSKIDQLSANLSKQIETLKEYKKSIITQAVTKGLDPNVKMKDSGIEWIGKMPATWSLPQVGFLTKSRSGATPDRNNQLYWQEGTIQWVASGEVNKEHIYESNERITTEGWKSISSVWFPKGTVFVALNGQGKTKGMSAVLETEASCNQSLVGFIPKSNSLNSNFLFYCFKAMYKFLRNQKGDNLRDGLAASFVRKQVIPYPCYSDQCKIAHYLDNKCQIIDTQINNLNEQKSTLASYKKSLIFDYVTGKKEVPSSFIKENSNE